MTTERRSPLLVGLGLLAAALFLGSIVIAFAVRDLRRAGDQVTVTGSVKRPVRADLALWRGSIGAQGPSLPDASQQLQRQADRVRGFLREQGIADSAISVRPIDAQSIGEYSETGRETGRVLGYRLSQTFEVRSTDIDRITALSQRTGDLIAQGVPVVASSPEYLYTKLADVRAALLGDATKDAKERAQVIAESVGGTVGSVREARMGVFQITPRFSTEVSDYGMNDVSAIDKDVTAVVRVTFSIR